MIAKLLGATAALLGLVALFGGSPYPGEIDAITLATWIRAQRPDLRVVDLRTAAEFDAFHIPSAATGSVDTLLASPPAAAETLVVYADGRAAAQTAVAALRVHGMPRAVRLRGGVAAWIDDVMQPTIASDASPAEREVFARLSEISRYFGGTPQVVYPGDPPRPRLSPEDGDAASRAEMLAKIARMKRRGC